MKRTDEWFLQHDIERRFVAFSDWHADLVPIFEQRDSYVESLYFFCLPIPVRRLARAFEETSWHFEYVSSRARLFPPASKHFLSRALRNRAAGIELRWLGSHYFYIDPTTNETVARQDRHEEPAYRSKRILVRSSLLRHFLADTRQALLWCVSSHRRTERSLDEFAIQTYEETIQRDQCIYLRAANPITPEGKEHLPRIESCTRITGKRRIHELDLTG